MDLLLHLFTNDHGEWSMCLTALLDSLPYFRAWLSTGRTTHGDPT